MVIRKPILIGGLGLSALLWLGGSTSGLVADWGQDALVLLMLLGGGSWWLRRRSRPRLSAQLPLTPLTDKEIQDAIAQAQALLNQLKREAIPSHATAPSSQEETLGGLDFAQQLQALSARPPERQLQGAIVGQPYSGKKSLQACLTEAFREKWHWTSQELTATLPDLTPADLVLYLVTGDLTAADRDHLHALHQQHHTLLLLLTKQDQRPAEQTAELLATLRQRVADFLPTEQIFALAAAPQAITVRHYQADGTITETQETPAPQWQVLRDRVTTLTAQAPDLHRATQWRQLRQLQRQIHAELNNLRRDRALPVIERYQWVAAGTAIANPMAALDVLAAIAINAQMIVDLGAIYQQSFTLAQAETAARELGQLIVKLGIVELSTQTLTHLLKSSPVTYLAGGAIQGASAAYLTRIVGLSLVTYFAEQDPQTPQKSGILTERLGAIAQTMMQKTERWEILRTSLRQFQSRWGTAPSA